MARKSKAQTTIESCIHEYIETNQLNITPREREVLVLMACGMAGAEDLAKYLEISVNTVQNHIKGLLRGTGTNSKTELLALLLQHALGVSVAPMQKAA